jgi:tripartite-type tricarboxylate transporter receptor subunit TctC
MTNRRSLLGVALLGLACTPGLIGTAVAQTDSYPSRPITILVPFPPGGSSDTVLRPVAQKAAESMGGSVVIENRTGGGGNTATFAAKQSAPDGYTLLLANNGTFAINPALFPDLRFDPVKDFSPITPIVSFPSVLAVPADLPARTVKELVDLANSRPNGLSFGSQSVGSGGHILGEMFRLKSGAKLVHVPYRGAGPAVIDLLGGRIDLLFTSYISVSEHAKAGKIRLLGWTTTKRSATIPDVPTMAEAGYPGVELEVWHGIVGPAGMPAPVVRKLNEALVKAARSPEIAAMLAPQAAEVLTATPEQFGKLIASDLAALGAVIRDAGIKAQ